MKACWCAMPAINGNNDCCKHCPNYDTDHKSSFVWTTVGDETIIPAPFDTFDWSKYYGNLKIKPMIDVVKENIDGLTIKELKELIEYMKKFDGLK